MRFIVPILGGALLAVSSIAQGAWSSVILHPPSGTNSYAVGMRLTTQAGNVDGNVTIWTGTAGSATPIGPGEAFGHDGVEQVGRFNGRAALWAGAPGTYVDLHPVGVPGVTYSYAMGVFAGDQVGFTGTVNGTQAAMWTGSAASYQSLHPAGAIDSEARGTYIGQQGGFVRMPTSGLHASVWYGSAASVVDVHPATGYFESRIYSVNNGRQAGYALTNTSDYHAALWQNTSASFVDLHPSNPAIYHSIANAVVNTGTNTKIAGQVSYSPVVNGGLSHAAYWNGNAASFVDLHQYLPAGVFDESWALGVYVSPLGVTYVTGLAGYDDRTRTSAVMWILPVPEPTSISLLALVGMIALRRAR